MTRITNAALALMLLHLISPATRAQEEKLDDFLRPAPGVEFHLVPELESQLEATLSGLFTYSFLKDTLHTKLRAERSGDRTTLGFELKDEARGFRFNFGKRTDVEDDQFQRKLRLLGEIRRGAQYFGISYSEDSQDEDEAVFALYAAADLSERLRFEGTMSDRKEWGAVLFTDTSMGLFGIGGKDEYTDGTKQASAHFSYVNPTALLLATGGEAPWSLRFSRGQNINEEVLQFIAGVNGGEIELNRGLRDPSRPFEFGQGTWLRYSKRNAFYLGTEKGDRAWHVVFREGDSGYVEFAQRIDADRNSALAFRVYANLVEQHFAKIDTAGVRFEYSFDPRPNAKLAAILTADEHGIGVAGYFNFRMTFKGKSSSP